SSPSIARRFASMLDFAGISAAEMTTRIATISPVTTVAARECGLPVAAEAAVYTLQGILAAIQNQPIRH
ncbi:MAG: uroporphyrinogen-III synthase, partial [Planctomycetia bacterium]